MRDHATCKVVLLNDMMDQRLLSLGTLASEAPYCWSNATWCQVYFRFDTDDIFLASLLI